MAKRVFLHVGLPKSGTSYLQAILIENSQQLQERSQLLFPGLTWAHQVAAVRDVRGMPFAPSEREKVRGAWPRLVGEIAAWQGDAVVSMEWLCRAQSEQIRRIVEDLEPSSVEVIFTLRDLGRTIPAAWQESIQNRHDWSWSEFLAGVTGDEPRTKPGRRFWYLHDVEQLLSQWSQHLPAEKLHVVTLPRRGSNPTVLWERFCQVLDVDGSGYTVEGRNPNESLGLESVELLRRLNPLARAAGVDKLMHKRLVKRGLAKRGLAKRAQQEPRLALPNEAWERIQIRAVEQIKGLETVGVHIVGDLDELRPEAPEGAGSQPEDIGTDALLEVALDGLVTLLLQHDEALIEAAAEHAEQMAQRDAALKQMSGRNSRLGKRNAALRLRIAQLESRPFRSALAKYRRKLPM